MKENGFTLIEMLVTVTILGLLASVVVPLADLSVQRQKEQDLRYGLRKIRTALDAYKQAVDDNRIHHSVEKSGYPPDLSALVKGVVDAKDPAGRKIYFLRRIPQDPFRADAQGDTAATWGVRSYSSEPSNPKGGEDVYDIYSLSDKIGLNGIPYREW